MCAPFHLSKLAITNKSEERRNYGLKKYCTEIILAIILLALSLISIFVGVIDIDIKDLLTNDNNALMIFVVSRLPRLLAIICTGMGMSVAGLIMQQLCMNKFVSPTTGATISSAQLGILLALLFIPNSTLWQRAGFAFVTAILGTWVFVWFIQKVQYTPSCRIHLQRSSRWVSSTHGP